MYETLRYAVDPNGVATLSLDVPGRSVNIFTPALMADLRDAVNAAAASADVKGLLITSAKAAFVGGADIKDLVAAFESGLSLAEGYLRSQALSSLFRRIETCGKPVVAAINGAALGGGFELALACHYRVLADDPKAVVGLPEVKLGLLAGAGGTQRVARLLGIGKAAKVLTEGASVLPAEALKLGLVHEIAPAATLIERARAWLGASPEPVAPWDRKGFRVPGGVSIADPAVGQSLMFGTALASKVTAHKLPAPRAILSAIYEGASVPFETALRVESKYIAQLLASAPARHIMRTLFVNKGKLDGLVRRPADEVASSVRKLGVLGAGMMGAGIAHVSALAGIEVVLLDTTMERAVAGKAHAAALLGKEVERGRRPAAAAEEVLSRIAPTTDLAALAGCDFVIEAVYEDVAVKAEITRRVGAVLPRDAVFASNTSTLPIAVLAGASPQPHQFIGVHFFSPVEKMPLVEIIVARQTAPATLARALDYVRQLRKTPIVVNDSRGFFTSRVFSTYCNEGMAMLAEGVRPALIENAARMAGMPVGPLAVSDEVSLELHYRIACQSRADPGADYVELIGWPVIRRFVEDLRRMGRRNGAGFYDYPADGAKYLWSGLTELFPPAPVQPPAEEVMRRLLHIQALEAARCFAEQVVTTAAEADIGSILGIGFPAWTGGALSYIDAVGTRVFVAECEALAVRYGSRFRPPQDLVERAERNEPFQPLLRGDAA